MLSLSLPPSLPLLPLSFLMTSPLRLVNGTKSGALSLTASTMKPTSTCNLLTDLASSHLLIQSVHLLIAVSICGCLYLASSVLEAKYSLSFNRLMHTLSLTIARWLVHKIYNHHGGCATLVTIIMSLRIQHPSLY